MGERPPFKTIDRLNNEIGYEPGNCRWATNQEQSYNRKNSRLVMLEGELISTSEAIRRLGIGNGAITDRMRAHNISRQEAVDYYAAKIENVR
jgi:hypothetical protein